MRHLFRRSLQRPLPWTAHLEFVALMYHLLDFDIYVNKSPSPALTVVLFCMAFSLKTKRQIHNSARVPWQTQ